MNKIASVNATKDMDRRVGLELGDLICEILTFCYSDAHKSNLEKDARSMPGNPTFEQFVAAALTHRISEEFDVRQKCSPQSQE
jgi:hypothetical protein